MKALKTLFSLVLLLNLSASSAQSTKLFPGCTILIESGEGNNKKSCLGYFYTFELTKDNLNYGSILTTKAVINNSSEIKLLFEKEDYGTPSKNKDTYNILTLPVRAIEIIQDNNPGTDLVAIPFGQIHQLMYEKDIYADPVFMDQDYLRDPRVQTPIKENDLAKLDAIWEEKLEEWMKNNKAK